MLNIQIPESVKNAQKIFVNHSGGKDSQAMLAALIRLGLKDKLVILHSDLKYMEWEPMHGWIEKNSFGLPVHVVSAETDFFELCYKYKRIPDGRARFCTNELKTRPCEKFIREYCQKNNITKCISALGIRAEESTNRAKLPLIKQKTKLITVWLPIFDYILADVKNEISNAGQELHPVYALGVSRLSCVMCPLARIKDHQIMARERPELFERFVKLERDLGKTIRLKQRNKIKYPKYLTEYIKTNETKGK